MIIFLKLGGSLITDKKKKETARLQVIRRLAREIRAALDHQPDLRLLLGHGSGSFGHYAAERTRLLSRDSFDPMACAEVAAAAARLNRIVTDVCLAEGVPAVSLPPSASARCSDGRLQYLATAPIETLLAESAVPLVYGDVALDTVRGAAIVSTEDVFVYLADVPSTDSSDIPSAGPSSRPPPGRRPRRPGPDQASGGTSGQTLSVSKGQRLRPTRIILAGEVDGVFTADPTRNPAAKPIRELTPATFPAVAEALEGATGFDVTGGMLSKVRAMVNLVAAQPDIEVYVISGLEAGRVEHALTADQVDGGTTIRA